MLYKQFIRDQREILSFLDYKLLIFIIQIPVGLLQLWQARPACNTRPKYVLMRYSESA